MKLTPLLILVPAIAMADIIGTIEATKGRVVLHDTKHNLCVGKAYYAEWQNVNGEKTRGCWQITRDGMVQIIFLDADAVIVRFENITPPKKT